MTLHKISYTVTNVYSRQDEESLEACADFAALLDACVNLSIRSHIPVLYLQACLTKHMRSFCVQIYQLINNQSATNPTF